MNDLNLPIILAEFLTKSAIIIALGFMILAAVKSIFPAAEKHGLWLRVFAVTLVIPVLLVVFPRWEIVPGFQKQAEVESSLIESAVKLTNYADLITTGDSGIAAASKSKFKFTWSLALIVTWAVGLSLFVIRSILAGVYLRKVEGSAVLADGELFEKFTNLNDAPERGTTLLVSSLVTSPFTWGLSRPRVVLPASATTWSSDDLEMILLHELEHVRRRDAVSVFISRVFLALNWANPLAWIANRHAIQLREEACDARVINAGHTSGNYAEMLFRQAQTTSNPYLQTCATAVAETGTIEQRIKMILNPKHPNQSAESQSPVFTKILTTAFIGVFVFVGIVGPQKLEAQAAPKENVAKGKVTQTKLETLKLPSVEFVDTSLPDALKFLQMRSAQLDLNEKDPKKKGINIAFGGLADEVKETKITLKLTNVSMYDALRFSCSLAQVGFEVDGDTVIVTPKTATPAPPEKGGDAAKLIGANKAKLKAIVLPAIEFNDTKFTDALQFLQQRSMKLDPEADPNKKGINIVLNTKNVEGVADTRISLKLSNVPLGEALRYTCALANLEYEVEPHTIVISPKAEAKK